MSRNVTIFDLSITNKPTLASQLRIKMTNAPIVRNITGHAGNKVANQFEVITDNGRFFQSYQSMIAFIPNDNTPVQLDSKYWDYSTTTGKYRNLFLGEKKSETEAKIKKGIYILVDLN